MKRSGGMAGGMQNIMRQANQLQMKVKKLQDELAEREHEGSAGGGAVSAKVKGESQVVALKIADDVVKAGDVEMLQELVVAAVNDALKKAKEIHAAEMAKVTGGFNLPF